MNEVYLRICLTQLLNTITVFLFYLFDNPVRNLILSEGYPIIFSTIFVFIFAPLTLTYLICYWLFSSLRCFYNCVENCCIILHDWGTGVRSCTASWKVCYRGAGGEDHALREGGAGGGGGGVSDEVTSLPPSYHSSLPPYIPPHGTTQPHHTRRFRNQEASLAALRGALSEVRQPGSDSWEPRHGLRHNVRQLEDSGREVTPLPLQVTPLPPPYRPPPRYTTGPPPQYTEPQESAAPPGYNDIDSETFSQRDQLISHSQPLLVSDNIRRVGLDRDIP